MVYHEQYARYVSLIEKTMEQLLPVTCEELPPAGGPIPAHLNETMRYSLLAGGKRVRPVLLLAACDMLDCPIDEANVSAAALEMIHTYSLIHDDLPGMDDDDYRRGRLTNHKVYGVGAAILAGDGLLNYAYECMLADALAHPENMMGHVKAASAIAECAGVKGMIAGQSIDLRSEHAQPDPQTLSYIHVHKCGDLLTAPLLAAAYLAGASEAQTAALERYGASLGLAFQIDDDLLDLEGDASELGKQTGMDAQRGKMTWPSLFGIEESRKRSRALWQEAEDALESFGDKAWFLREFAKQLRDRKK